MLAKRLLFGAFKKLIAEGIEYVGILISPINNHLYNKIFCESI